MAELIVGIIAAIGAAFGAASAIQPMGSVASSLMSADANRRYAEASMKRRKLMAAKEADHANG